MAQISSDNADALGIKVEEDLHHSTDSSFSEQLVWDQLKTCYDPEIPVNIVELGLIYDLNIKNEEDGATLRLRDNIQFSTDDSTFYTMWHAGNDGSGSTLDADLLDGQEGSYYTNAANLTGTLPAIDGSNLTGVSANIGITTNLSGTFTASAGSPSTINTFGYGSGDLVVEYTIYIKNGSDFQTQKLLAMRDGTTIHSTQFAVMFSSSLLVQCDATISSGNILLRATPETGVSGSTTYKIKREVM